MIDVRYKDINPDTGFISNDVLIATCMNESLGKWILRALEGLDDGMEPNREYYLVGSDKEYATYEQRVGWFIQNYYETGMEYEILLETLKDRNLDSLETPGGIISIPKLCKDLAPKSELDI